MQAQSPIRIGYVRVSSADQNIDRQLDGENLTVTFVDKASGKNADRPQLQALLAGNWPRGSVVVVHSMDRLARSLSDLLRIVEQLTSRGIAVHFVKEAKIFKGDGSDAMDKLMLSMLGAFAEYCALPDKRAIALKPKTANFEEAAALPFGGRSH